ncbi:hypothetical protein ACUN9Z_23195, partial [Escherichia sp. HC-CC4]
LFAHLRHLITLRLWHFAVTIFAEVLKGQIAFNLGSAVGAYCGGMMLTLGLAYNYVALPAALLSFAAMSSLLLYGRYKRQQAADSPVLAKPLG